MFKQLNGEDKNCSTIELSLDGQRCFAKLMDSPPKPTEAMAALGEMDYLEDNIRIVKF